MDKKVTEAKVLGQLLFLQSTLDVMPERRGVTDLVCNGLKHVPGVASVSYLESSDQPASNYEHAFAVPITSRETAYGALVFDTDDSEEFAKYRPHIQNVANSIALVFDNRGYIGELNQRREELEQRVSERTAELEASKARLQSILEANPVPTIITRMADGTVKYANQRLMHDFGFGDKSAIGRKTPDFFAHSEERDVLMRELAEKGSLPSREILVKKVDGTQLWVLATLSMFQFEGEPCVMASLYDISERKEEEEKIRQFQHIVSATTDMLALLDKDFIYRATNPAYLAAFNKTYNEMVGHKASEIFGEAFFNEVIKPRGKRCMAGEEIEYEERFDFPAYEPRHMSIHYYPYINADNEVAGFVVNGRDITERRQANELLRKLSSAIDQAGESILITDKEGVIEYINPAFTKITGYTSEEAIGKTPRILKSGNQDDAFYETMWKTITDGRVWHGKVIDRRKDGSFYPAILTISPIIGETEDLTHFVGIQSDLSELESMEKQFQQAQKMEAIGTLVGGIAHDFNNMLAGITGNIYLAKQDAKQLPDVVNRLDRIEQVSLRAADMISQLLTFARKGIVSMNEMPLTSFIKETIKFLHSSVPENITMHQDICTEPLQIKGDATQLHQVLMNLLNNACDAVEDEDGPCISVRLEAFHPDNASIEAHSYFKDEAYAHLSVEDNGCGIPERQIKHLFEPFFTTKEQGKGTGLGLSMVFGAIKTHHGFIEVDSIEGKGSTFHVYMPLLAQKAIAPVASLEQETVRGHGELILLTDDEKIVRKTTAEVLEAMGYRVLQATDGLKAIEIFKVHQEEIAIALLDVVMPHCGGVPLAKRIREIKPDVPVIFMTGYDKDHVLDDDEDVPNSKMLTKPVKFDVLSHLMHRLLD